MSHGQSSKGNPIDWERWANGLLAKNEDQAILAEMVTRLWQAVCAVVSRHIHDKQEAEALTGAIFFRIWNKRKRFDPARGSVWTWILRCVIHPEVQRYLRRKKKANRQPPVCYPHHVLEGLIPRYSETGASRAEEDLQSSDQIQRLRKAYASLGKRQQQVLETGDHFTDAEIAEQLGCTPGAVRKARHDGKTNLIERMTEDSDEK